MNNDAIPNIFFSLMHSYKLAMRSALQANEIGLNAMHVRCLPFIHKREGCTANDLVTCFQRDKAQIARLIKEMIANNWITKTASLTDKRSQLLSLTEEGEALVLLINETQHRVHQKMLENLTLEELSAFNKIASQMSANLKDF